MISKSIPLSKLYARSAERAESTAGLVGTGVLTELGRSIEQLGVLNPLFVQLPNAASKGDWYRVIHGIRRLEAMKVLALQGKIPRDYEVPCVLPDKRLTEKEFLEYRSTNPRTSEAGLMPFQRDLIAQAKRKQFFVPAQQVGKTSGLMAWLDSENQGGKIAVMHADGSVEMIDLDKRDLYERSQQLSALWGSEVGEAWRGQARQSEDRYWRMGSRQPATVTCIDWAAVEIRMAQKLAAIQTKVQYFDLGDQW